MTWMLQEKHAADLVCPRAAAVLHRRSQDFFFLGSALFLLKKVEDLFYSSPSIHMAETTESTTPTLQLSPPAKISSQI